MMGGANNQYVGNTQNMIDGSMINLANNNTGSGVNSPVNMMGQDGGLLNQGKIPGIITDPAADLNQPASQKRLRSQQNYLGNMSTQAALNAIAANQAQNQLQGSSVGSGGTPNMQMLDESQRRDLLLKNAKSLGNSLGTANKKTLNISHHGNAGLAGLAGIERE